MKMKMKIKTLLSLSLPLTCLASSLSYADFRSPSGNVVCSTSADLNPKGGVYCYVGTDNSKPPIPKPRDCDYDWGGAFGVEKTGRTQMYCVSDYPFDPNPTVLNYGQTLKGKTYECTSLTTGMTCKNTSGHGFTLSKSSQSIF